MTLRREEILRIDGWLAALQRRMVTALDEVPTELATTMDHLTPEQADELDYRPASPGKAWGAKWEYAWFRTRCEMPRSPRGRHVVLLVEVDENPVESIVWINGIAAGGIDKWHHHVDLSALAKAGDTLDVRIESYAGHGPTPHTSPFVTPGQEVIPEPPRSQRRFRCIRLALWNEPLYQLYMDAATLRDLIECLDEHSLRRCRVERALMAATVAVDVEADEAELDRGVREGRKLLAEPLECRNGDTAPEFTCFGHSHIDVAWLWPLQHTFRKCGHTFASMLALMDRYRDFRFLQSQAVLYDFVKRDYPELYERIKRAVRRGQWTADGGMWVEPDTNVSGGEALIRQFLYGKRFFREEFGVDSRMCWLPDVFGYSAALPQILVGCGMKYFTTQKIFWNLHGGTEFPYETFTWEGIDGSEVLVQLHRNYNAQTGPQRIARRWHLCVDKGHTERLLYPFGYGDGGGGPTRDHLEYLAREGDLEGLPRTRQAAPSELLDELAKGDPPANRYVGELYLELHRGTLTSQARTKRFNRKCELALREAELWAAAAAAVAGADYPADRLEEAWKAVLLNQFHDILPGSSIGRVYEEAEALYEETLESAEAMAADARRALLDDEEDGWTVFNSLSWPRDAIVSLPTDGDKVPVDAAGEPLPCQRVGRGSKARLLTAVDDLPAMGAVTLRLAEAEPAEPVGGVSAESAGGGAKMENEFLRLRIDRHGRISDLYDKTAHRQIAPRGEALNRLELYKDNPADWDAWDIDRSYKLSPVELGPAERVEVVAAGPVEARVAVTRKIGEGSTFEQEIVLRCGSARIDFETVVDWQEMHRLLKVAFPADLHPQRLRGDVQFGHIQRPTHRNTEFEQQRYEWVAQKWADVSEGEYGLAVLNDCKYGHDFLDGVLRLSLLRSSMSPHPGADRGRHEFTYAVLPHVSGGAPVETVLAGYELNCPVSVLPGSVAGGAWQFMEAVRETVVETVKRSEDGKATVLRLYEPLGRSADCSLRTCLEVDEAAECDMLENSARKLRLRKDGTASLKFRPFEIKTVRLEDA
jgi:alpha-mannosidase